MGSRCAGRCRTASARWSAPSSSSIISGLCSSCPARAWTSARIRISRVPLHHGREERVIYLVEGAVDSAGDRYEGPRLLIFRPGDRITAKATRPVRMMFLGGDALEGTRHIWWNFVSSSKERIEQAKADWKSGRFAHVPNETEFIPLPE